MNLSDEYYSLKIYFIGIILMLNQIKFIITITNKMKSCSDIFFLLKNIPYYIR